MKYTKDNITGVKFLGCKDPFLVLAVEGDRVKMGYAPEHPNPLTDFFHNSLELTLRYFNDGTWKVIEKGEPIYAIY